MRPTVSFLYAATLYLLLSGAATAAPVLYANGFFMGVWGNNSNIQGFHKVFNSFLFTTQQTIGSVTFGLVAIDRGSAVNTVDFSFQPDTGADPTTTPATFTTVPVSAILTGTLFPQPTEFYLASFSLPTPVTLPAGSYWFGLGNLTGGWVDTLSWDMCNGPSIAYASDRGQLPSSNFFQLIGTPELDPSAATLPFAFLAFSLLAVGSRRRSAARP